MITKEAFELLNQSTHNPYNVGPSFMEDTSKNPERAQQLQAANQGLKKHFSKGSTYRDWLHDSNTWARRTMQKVPGAIPYAIGGAYDLLANGVDAIPNYANLAWKSMLGKGNQWRDKKYLRTDNNWGYKVGDWLTDNVGKPVEQFINPVGNAISGLTSDNRNHYGANLSLWQQAFGRPWSEKPQYSKALQKSDPLNVMGMLEDAGADGLVGYISPTLIKNIDFKHNRARKHWYMRQEKVMRDWLRSKLPYNTSESVIDGALPVVHAYQNAPVPVKPTKLHKILKNFGPNPLFKGGSRPSAQIADNAEWLNSLRRRNATSNERMWFSPLAEVSIGYSQGDNLSIFDVPPHLRTTVDQLKTPHIGGALSTEELLDGSVKASNLKQRFGKRNKIGQSPSYEVALPVEYLSDLIDNNNNVMLKPLIKSHDAQAITRALSVPRTTAEPVPTDILNIFFDANQSAYAQWLKKHRKDPRFNALLDAALVRPKVFNFKPYPTPKYQLQWNKNYKPFTIGGMLPSTFESQRTTQ